MARKYELDINLYFESEADASEVLNKIAELGNGLYAPRDKDLIAKLTQQIDGAITEIGRIKDGTAELRPEVVDLLMEASKALESAKGYKVECEQKFHDLESQWQQLRQRVESTVTDSTNKIKAIEAILAQGTSKLANLDNLIKDVNGRIEACAFIKDMSRVKDSILTGGKMVLKGPDDLGNPAVKRVWNLQNDV